jgi:O-antigen ligase
MIWPPVIRKISEAPALGYGRLAMVRTGLEEYLLNQVGPGEAVSHPHNAYLELLLDNGAVGAAPVAIFFLLVLWYSAKLFCDRDPVRSAGGGVALAMILAQVVSGLGSQHVYPMEGTMGMYAAVFLVLRIHTDCRRRRRRLPALGVRWQEPSAV